MLESEWLACDNPQRMLAHIEGKVSDRKLRLLACACRRCVPSFDQQWENSGWDKMEEDGQPSPKGDDTPAISDVTMFLDYRQFSPLFVDRLREIVGNPFWSWMRNADGTIGRVSGVNVVDQFRVTPTVLSLAQVAYDERPGRVCGKCNSGRVYYASISQPLAYRECFNCHGTGRIDDGTLDPLTLAAVADAMEEAGCGSEPLLRHLRGLVWGYGELSDSWQWFRSPGPHVRGCWALDLILGKE